MTGAPDDRTAALRRQRRTQSEHKHRAVKAAVANCAVRGQPESAAAIARAAGTTETFLYRHEAQPCALCDHVFGGGPVSYYRAQMALIADSRDATAERQGRVTEETTQAELANCRATTQRLRQQVRALERRLGEVFGARAQGSLPNSPGSRRTRILPVSAASATC